MSLYHTASTYLWDVGWVVWNLWKLSYIIRLDPASNWSGCEKLTHAHLYMCIVVIVLN